MLNLAFVGVQEMRKTLVTAKKQVIVRKFKGKKLCN